MGRRTEFWLDRISRVGACERRDLPAPFFLKLNKLGVLMPGNFRGTRPLGHWET